MKGQPPTLLPPAADWGGQERSPNQLAWWRGTHSPSASSSAQSPVHGRSGRSDGKRLIKHAPPPPRPLPESSPSQQTRTRGRDEPFLRGEDGHGDARRSTPTDERKRDRRASDDKHAARRDQDQHRDNDPSRHRSGGMHAGRPQHVESAEFGRAARPTTEDGPRRRDPKRTHADRYDAESMLLPPAADWNRPRTDQELSWWRGTSGSTQSSATQQPLRSRGSDAHDGHHQSQVEEGRKPNRGSQEIQFEQPRSQRPVSPQHRPALDRLSNPQPSSRTLDETDFRGSPSSSQDVRPKRDHQLFDHASRPRGDIGGVLPPAADWTSKRTADELAWWRGASSKAEQPLPSRGNGRNHQHKDDKPSRSGQFRQAKEHGPRTSEGSLRNPPLPQTPNYEHPAQPLPVRAASGNDGRGMHINSPPKPAEGGDGGRPQRINWPGTLQDDYAEVQPREEHRVDHAARRKSKQSFREDGSNMIAANRFMDRNGEVSPPIEEDAGADRQRWNQLLPKRGGIAQKIAFKHTQTFAIIGHPLLEEVGIGSGSESRATPSWHRWARSNEAVRSGHGLSLSSIQNGKCVKQSIDADPFAMRFYRKHHRLQRQSKREWQCQFCMHGNAPFLSHCEICHFSKPLSLARTHRDRLTVSLTSSLSRTDTVQGYSSQSRLGDEQTLRRRARRLGIQLNPLERNKTATYLRLRLKEMRAELAQLKKQGYEFTLLYQSRYSQEPSQLLPPPDSDTPDEYVDDQEDDDPEESDFDGDDYEETEQDRVLRERIGKEAYEKERELARKRWADEKAKELEEQRRRQEEAYSHRIWDHRIERDEAIAKGQEERNKAATDDFQDTDAERRKISPRREGESRYKQSNQQLEEGREEERSRQDEEDKRRSEDRERRREKQLERERAREEREELERRKVEQERLRQEKRRLERERIEREEEELRREEEERKLRKREETRRERERERAEQLERKRSEEEEQERLRLEEEKATRKQEKHRQERRETSPIRKASDIILGDGDEDSRLSEQKQSVPVVERTERRTKKEIRSRRKIASEQKPNEEEKKKKKKRKKSPRSTPPEDSELVKYNDTNTETETETDTEVETETEAETETDTETDRETEPVTESDTDTSAGGEDLAQPPKPRKETGFRIGDIVADDVTSGLGLAGNATSGIVGSPVQEATKSKNLRSRLKERIQNRADTLVFVGKDTFFAKNIDKVPFPELPSDFQVNDRQRREEKEQQIPKPVMTDFTLPPTYNEAWYRSHLPLVIRAQTAIRGRLARRRYAKQKERAKIAYEIFTTEKSYLEALSHLYECRRKLDEDTKIKIKPDKLKTIWQEPLKDMVELARVLCARLESKVSPGRWHAYREISDVFLDLGPRFSVYVPYIIHYNEALEALHELNKSNKRFKQFSEECSRAFKFLDFEAILIMPIQRIPRYILLLKALVKVTQRSHPDYDQLNKALDLVSTIATDINNQVKKYENHLTVCKIDSLLVPRIKDFAQPEREFVGSGMVIMYDDKKKLRRNKQKVRTVFLFSDVFLLTKHIPSSGVYHLKFVIYLNPSVHIEHNPYVKDVGNEHVDCVFRLHSERANQSITLMTRTMDEKISWLIALEQTLFLIQDKMKGSSPSG